MDKILTLFSILIIIFLICIQIQNSLQAKIKGNINKENDPNALPIVVDASDLGLIRGYPGWTFTGKKFWMFHGIPYAESTEGDGRFKPSVLRNRTLSPGGTFNAWNPLIFCPQNDLLRFVNHDEEFDAITMLKAQRRLKMAQREGIKPSVWGKEDCLVLNVFTKNIHRDQSLPPNPLLPVLFYIHGGSSDSALGGVFGGLTLLDEPIVLVSINYRLGALGALNLGVNDAPGNAAMYDSITALRWVNKYIYHFGGDPNHVILSGHSAGSMMVTQILLSPMGKGLFHGVIGMSGTALSSWATATHPSIHHHLHVSKYAGCYDGPTDLEDINLEEIDFDVIVNCMRLKSVETLISAVDRHSSEQQLLGNGMGYDDKVPSIQAVDNLPGMEIFLAKSPLEIIEAGEQSNVPIMIGATRHDGTMALEKTYYDYLKPNNLVEDELFLKNELIPKLCELMGVQDRTEALYSSLASAYMGKNKNSGNWTKMLPGLIDIHSVFAFKSGGYNLVEKHSKLNPNSYFYSFDYDGLWTVYDPRSDIPGGIAHVEDIMYLFFGSGIMITPNDRAVSNRYVKYWVNFMYNGNPNSPEGPNEWLSYSPENHTYRSINTQDETLTWVRDSWIGPGYEIADDGNNEVTTTTTTSTTTRRSATGGSSCVEISSISAFVTLLSVIVEGRVF